MASSQQQKLTPPPQPQKQNVTVCCKAYPNKYMGMENGIVRLVDSKEIWEEVEDKTVISPVPIFALMKNGMALAHRDEKVTLVTYKGVVEPDMRWSHAQGVVFTPISTPDTDVNLDVVERTLVVDLQKPHAKESQLWKISAAK